MRKVQSHQPGTKCLPWILKRAHQTKANVIRIPTPYNAPNCAICDEGQAKELDDHATGTGTPELIPISYFHELDMDVDTYMSTPKPSVLLKLLAIIPSVLTNVE